MSQSTHKPPPSSEDSLRTAAERMELLEVIREIVDQEIDAKLKEYIQVKFPEYDKESAE